MRSQMLDEKQAPSLYRQSPESSANAPISFSYQSPDRFAPLRGPQQSAMSGKRRAKSASSLAPFEGWFALILLGVALYCVVASIIAAQWVDHSGLLLVTPVAGLLMGLIVAKMPHFPQFILHLGACLVGHWLSVWLTSVIAFQVPLAVVLADLRAAFTGQFMSLGEPASEIIFFFYLSFLCFFLGYFGSWLVYRAHLPWLAALVLSSIMLVNLNYVKSDMSYLVIVMVAALLLLVARMQLVVQVVRWKQEGLYTDRQWLNMMKWRCMQAASIIAVLTLVLGWFLPIQGQNNDGKVFWAHLDAAWTDAITGRFSWKDLQAFVTPSDQANIFSDQLTISNTVRLPTSEILRYEAIDGLNAGHYLEGSTFDTFDGHTWTSSLDATKSGTYQPNDLLLGDIPDQGPGGEHIKISITLPPNGAKNYIFAPANPRSFSVPTIVYYDGTAWAWTQQEPLSVSETYVATFAPSSVVPVTSPPLNSNIDWQKYNLPLQYLQVPVNISPQVQQKVQAWTSDAADGYIALKLLEEHLRDKSVFTYSLDNPPVPANTDTISWLLQTRTGYCTHYATAMAIMGRMLHIPTRIVNGFSQGRYDADSNQWVVNGSDAHSWVQAFFPNSGWINFDPTPGFAPSALPAQQAPHTPSPSPTAVASTPTVAAQATPPTLPDNRSNNSSSSSTQAGDNNIPWIVISLSGLFLAIILLLVAVIRYWWLNLYASSPLVSAMYWRFCRVAHFLGMAPRTWQTPYEYGRMIGQRFPHQAHAFWRLTDLFVREHWGGPQHITQGLKETEVKDLSPSLRSLLLNFFIDKFRRKPHS
jgi:transglutaminase-like putative cysteine protease